MFRLRLALCCLMLTTPALGNDQHIADAIYYGGDIITLDDSQPSAEAVAVSDGRIAAVGTLADVVRIRGAGTELIDLNGRTLVPGFIDAHGHLSRVGVQALTANLLRPPEGRSRTIQGLVETLREWEAETIQVGEFGLIIGFGYEESQLTHRRWLTRFDLDGVSRELPVIAIHRSGNRSVFNSRALELAGIRAETPDPVDGRIHRYEGSYEPNGVLEKAAHYTALRRVLAELTERDLTALVDAGQHLYARFGQTTAQDARPAPAVLAAYPEMAADGRLKIDVIAYPDLEKDGDNPVLHGPWQSREYTNGFRVGGVMLRMEGVLRPETARLRESYLRPASGPLNKIGGDATFDDGEVEARLAKAYRNGWQVMVYANGDAAIDQFLRAERVAAAAVPGISHRSVMIQGQRLDPEHLAALEDTGIVPALLLARRPAPKEHERHLVFARVPDSGRLFVHDLMAREMIFTTYHDAPASSPNAMDVLSTAIDERGRRGMPFEFERTAVRLAALKSVTLWAAHQYFEENAKGSIEVGKLADLVILSANPLKAPAHRIAAIEVEETIKEGQRIYQREHGTQAQESKAPVTPLACAEVRICFEGMTAALNRAAFEPGGRESLPPGRSASLSEP